MEMEGMLDQDFPVIAHQIQRDLELLATADLCTQLQERGGLLVVTDFDGCLTFKFTDGNVTSIMEVVRANIYARDRRLYDELMTMKKCHQVIRSDESLSLCQQRMLFDRSWRRTLELLSGASFVDAEFFDEVTYSNQLWLRTGTADWLEHLRDLGADVTIYSASCVGANVIPRLLRMNDIKLWPGLRIISNGLDLEAAGKPPLHTEMVTPLNKCGLQVTRRLEAIPANALILGDSLTDLDVRKGLPCYLTKTIGIAGNRERELFARYYDYVAPSDVDMPHIFG